MPDFPTQLFNDLFLLAVIILGIAPLLSGYATYKIGKVLFSDTARPRNKVLGRMFGSGLSIVIAGFYISALCVGYVIDFFQGESLNADFGALTFTVALMIVHLQPFFNWIVLRSVGSAEITGGKETQNQREDRRFGAARRLLERQHGEAAETQNQRADRVAGDILRAEEDKRLDRQ